MSDLARAFLERWVMENVSSVPPQLQQAEVERLVAACLSDAYEQGFTEEEMTEACEDALDGEDLTTFMSRALDEAEPLELAEFAELEEENE